MKNLIFICTMLIFFSCNKKDDNLNSTVNASSVEIAITNDDGEDLLDPNNPNAYQVDEIKLFYKINGEIVEVYDPMMDFPRNFYIFKHESEYRIRAFINTDEGSSQPITYIQWSENDRDTLKAEFRYPDQSVIMEKLWFNGEMWYHGEPVPGDVFVIIK